MTRISAETRIELAQLVEEIEREGYEVNRRALAREFGVSPQTVARILDGPGRAVGPCRVNRIRVKPCVGRWVALGAALVVRR
jgi:hypothetical protein